MKLFYDNQVVMCIVKNSIFHEHPKHIEIDCHFVRERLASGDLTPIYEVLATVNEYVYRSPWNNVASSLTRKVRHDQLSCSNVRGVLGYLLYHN